MTSISVSGSDSTASRSRGLYMLAVASLPLVVAGLLTLLTFTTGVVERGDGVGHKTVFAEILYPVPTESVSGNFEVQGIIKSVPANHVVYLVEYVDGLFWPKQRLGSTPTSFKREQHVSAGEGYKYTIELLSLDTDGEVIVEQWFNQGQLTGKYSGLQLLNEPHVLARARVILR